MLGAADGLAEPKNESRSSLIIPVDTSYTLLTEEGPKGLEAADLDAIQMVQLHKV